tara:strand:+ start:446 stop:904 length:459 start_codon:yes stop_codon:yes gene_type:complete
MLRKILFTISTFILLSSCEYKPIYSNLDNLNYEIIINETTGDKDLNKFIINNLKRNNKDNSNQIINIKLNTKYTKTITAKDAAGSITNYQSIVIANFEITKEQQSETFSISEKFNYQKISDSYEEKNYEDNIKRNLAKSISQKLILRLAIAQ